MAHAVVSASPYICCLLRGTAFYGKPLSLLWRPTALCRCIFNRTMSSSRKMDHLERTASNFRQEIISPAKVYEVNMESETVKNVCLTVANSDFTFKAGQWVDFFIPGVPKVGGFSICSSPGLLERERLLELAVKYAEHPPAHWIHTQCVPGSEVALRIGGDFFFDPQPWESPVNLVLIAGGVGINPLLSILLHVADLQSAQQRAENRFEMGTVKLYYSAKNTSELLFKKKILNLINKFPGKISCSFHVTQQTAQVCEELQPYTTVGRISEEDLARNVCKDNLYYICGPPPMIQSLSKQLENLHVTREQIRFEQWW
ncbi:oxidoreductase NAD-binding domain-containing protein 1 [Microcaecilia unicolor]|uniref:Oxidoreductase NAD-binding domain-containing protein 1 n=2 Tax=Microcaecilia unicolor TaxID=1415580 RepID=A0A6P7Y6R5_9AMPH|nr:oxidoreductase NAD-binding domain-containing protein 1-like [Microcaecilia unicolor]XP_030058418.1 oxidoreductase NAD-binding domain-containing protein 1-like [Microcaecilia unicolor]XP_030058426.1 oxidoreductase NAD-binding domain-containing protein 1-like [Microcaecilia unicolor]XP_030058434.1 oxidoreductase NAD-binding domain-containing protein 1-like [Microcaecilia unicolor]XP_030058443.1 oxidoreductase NAD-binding domain-containing protein 1-like [Microcaecilia unicolor]